MIALLGPAGRPVVIAFVAVHLLLTGVVAATGELAAARDGVADQMLFLDLAVLAAITSAVVNGAVVIRLRRRVELRRRRLMSDLDHRVLAAATARDVVGPGAGQTLVALPGMRYSHRPGCALVAGKVTGPAEEAHEPCGWCHS